MKVFITGASGFLGSALATRCLIDGHQVVALLRRTSSIERICDVWQRLSIAYIGSDASIVERIAAEQPDAILHTACSYARNGESSTQIIDANLRLGTLLLDGATQVGTRVAFLNTATVLSPSTSAYALSKHQFSAWGRSTATSSTGSNIQFIDVLLQHMYGPNDDSMKFPARIIRACRENATDLPLTAGRQQRDFIYIDDVTDAYMTILGNLDSFAVADEVELGSGRAPTVREFVETVHALTRSKTVLRFGSVPYRRDEPMLLRADLRRMHSLGWEPRFDLLSGLRRTIEAEHA